MRVYLTGDIHGDPARLWSIEIFCNNHKTTTNDWLICLGDVGLNYYGVKSKKEIRTKKEAAKLPIKMFCIHGNHERRPSETDGYQQVEVTEGAIKVQCCGTPNIQISISLLMELFIKFRHRNEH